MKILQIIISHIQKFLKVSSFLFHCSCTEIDQVDPLTNLSIGKAFYRSESILDTTKENANSSHNSSDSNVGINQH